MGMEFGSSEADDIRPSLIDGQPEPDSTPYDPASDFSFLVGMIPSDSPEDHDPFTTTYDSDLEDAVRAGEPGGEAGFVALAPGDGWWEQAENTVPGSDAQPVIPDSLIEAAESTLQSLARQAADSASAAPSHFGPDLVCSLDIADQIETTLEGTRSGSGFGLKVSMPGLDFPIEDLDARIEVLARLHAGGSPSDGPTAGTLLEVQFHEPPTGRGDVAPHHRLPDTSAGSGTPPAPTAGASSEDDPWKVWLDLVGAQLIRNLRWALTYVASLPAGTVQASIRIGVLPERPPPVTGGQSSRRL